MTEQQEFQPVEFEADEKSKVKKLEDTIIYLVMQLKEKDEKIAYLSEWNKWLKEQNQARPKH